MKNYYDLFLDLPNASAAIFGVSSGGNLIIILAFDFIAEKYIIVSKSYLLKGSFLAESWVDKFDNEGDLYDRIDALHEYMETFGYKIDDFPQMYEQFLPDIIKEMQTTLDKFDYLKRNEIITNLGRLL